jgi:hypothetical protein
MSTIKHVRQLIAVSAVVVEKMHQLYSELRETENPSTTLPTEKVQSPDAKRDYLLACVNSLSVVLSKCRRISVRLDLLKTFDDSLEQEEARRLLAVIEKEIDGVLADLGMNLEELERHVEKGPQSEDNDMAQLANLRLFKSN